MTHAAFDNVSIDELDLVTGGTNDVPISKDAAGDFPIATKSARAPTYDGAYGPPSGYGSDGRWYGSGAPPAPQGYGTDGHWYGSREAPAPHGYGPDGHWYGPPQHLPSPNSLEG